MSLTPIETCYKGYRFRSRLEARWAVFLDALQSKWSYELEGYELGGIWYLPDFFVADWDCWIEIKGKSPSSDEEAKCQRLADESGKVVLLVAGEPWTDETKNEYDITLFTCHDPDRNSTSGWEFGEGRKCAEEIWLVSEDYGAFTLKAGHHDRDYNYPLTRSARILTALGIARKARFEHGVSPEI